MHTTCLYVILRAPNDKYVGFTDITRWAMRKTRRRLTRICTNTVWKMGARCHLTLCLEHSLAIVLIIVFYLREEKNNPRILTFVRLMFRIPEFRNQRNRGQSPLKNFEVYRRVGLFLSCGNYACQRPTRGYRLVQYLFSWVFSGWVASGTQKLEGRREKGYCAIPVQYRISLLYMYCCTYSVYNRGSASTKIYIKVVQLHEELNT